MNNTASAVRTTLEPSAGYVLAVDSPVGWGAQSSHTTLTSLVLIHSLLGEWAGYRATPPREGGWTVENFTVRRILHQDITVGARTTVRDRATPPASGSSDVLEPLPALPTVPWYNVDGLEGMRLVVQRVKKHARAACPGVEFGAPMVQQLVDEEQPGGPLVVLRMYLPTSADDFEFRDRLFAALAGAMGPEDLARLAVRVLRLSEEQGRSL